MSAHRPSIRLGTRGSALAMAQSRSVAEAITERTGHSVELVIIRSEGDDHVGPLHEATRPGLFTSRLRAALLEGRVDVLVHSMKDLPSEPEPGIALAACPARADARDALVSRESLTLDRLPSGARVGTGSPRRTARLLHARPDLVVLPMRGNVDSRLAKVATAEFDAAVLAVAGLSRLGRATEITQVIEPEVMVPAPAQGALAVECRADDHALLDRLALLDDVHTRVVTTAERAVLTAVGATCATALGALATIDEGVLHLSAEVSGPAGQFAAAAESLVLTSDVADVVAARDLGFAVGRMLLEQGAGEYVTPRLPRAPATHATPSPSSPAGPRPLAARPVLLVRADVGDDRDAPALTQRGMVVVRDPYLRIDPSGDPGAEQRAREVLDEMAQGSDWCVLTSRAALRSLVALTSPHAVATAMVRGSARGLRVIAVGGATAALLREFGASEVSVPEENSAAGVLGLLAGERPGRVVLPRGTLAMGDIAAVLDERGWSTVDRVLYETTTVVERPQTADLLAAGHFSAIVLRSPSAVRAVAHHVPVLPVGTALACGGPSTAAEVRRLGLGDPAVGRGPSADDMADLVAAITSQEVLA